jgi:ribosome recycling factor
MTTATTSQEELTKRMDKSIKAFEEELMKYRAGRAHPNLLDSVMVSYYGNPTPLNQVASVIAEGPMLLVVKPWEKQLMAAIEKAILVADLGLNPSNSGDVIRVPLPPLSEERRKDLIKRVRTESEAAKIAIRTIRRDANQAYKDQLKEKIITEDEERRGQDLVQKLTDSYIAKIDQLVHKKEEDLLEF